MLPTTISCPACNKGLKLARIPPEGKRIVCLKCNHRFVPAVDAAPPAVPEPAPPASTPAAETIADVPLPPAVSAASPARRHAVLQGVAGAVVFVAIVVVGYFFLPRTDPEPVAQPTTEPQPAPTQREERDEGKEKAQAEERRRAEVQKLMIQGNAALADQRYEEAASRYSEALNLAPENLDAAKGLNTARTALAAATKEKQDADKTKSDLARLLDEGKQALADKKFAQAARTYEAALAVAPGDVIAKRGLEEANLALAADADEKKKLADYQKFMDAGRAAVVAQRYTDAIREYTAALAILPGDKAALDGRALAEKRITDVMVDDKQRGAFDKAMAQGAAAVKAKHYDEAVKAFEQAVKLAPGDKDAQAALTLAKKTLAETQTAFNNLMAQGDQATRLQRYEEAARYYAEANRLAPSNPNALAGLENAQRMMGSVQAGQTAYLRYMNTAAFAMQAKRWDEAARNYAEALRIAPNDRDATAGLREAQRGLDREARNRPQYNEAMQRAVALHKQQKYAEAAKAYQEALVFFPDDPAAVNGLHQVRYSQFMIDGEADMRAKKYAEAMRDYENALKEIPGDPTAARAWQQARALAQKK